METIGTLAGGIARDFNKVLGAILGYTEIAWSWLRNHRAYLSHRQKWMNQTSVDQYVALQGGKRSHLPCGTRVNSFARVFGGHGKVVGLAKRRDADKNVTPCPGQEACIMATAMNS